MRGGGGEARGSRGGGVPAAPSRGRARQRPASSEPAAPPLPARRVAANNSLLLDSQTWPGLGDSAAFYIRTALLPVQRQG